MSCCVALKGLWEMLPIDMLSKEISQMYERSTFCSKDNTHDDDDDD